MRKKAISCLMAAVMAASALTGCGSSVVDQAASQQSTTEAPKATTEAAGGTEETKGEEKSGPDLTDTVELKFNFALGNKSRTMTYNQESPLTLPDGTVVSAGMLKPMWSYVEKEMNSKFTDVTVQDIKATDMIQTESTSNFAGANNFWRRIHCRTSHVLRNRRQVCQPF